MGITYGDYLIDSGHYDITPEQEDARDGMAWWNSLDDEDREHWMHVAGDTGIAADAWRAFKATAQ